MNRTAKYILVGGALYLTGYALYKEFKATYPQANKLPEPRNQPDTMMYPVSNVRVTSNFGSRIDPITHQPALHNGTDFAGNVGDNIYSPYAGVVSAKNKTERGGNQLFIKHDNGLTSGFAHLNKYYVSPGQRVDRGQLIAEVGNTGTVTGSHLHYTLKNDTGLYLNPVKFLA